MFPSFDLALFLYKLKSHTKLLLIIPLLSLIIGMIYTHIIETPQFIASSQILISQKKAEANETIPTNNQSYLESMDTYTQIIKTPPILNKISKELKGKYSVNELKSMINIEQQGSSQIFTINVVTDSSKNSIFLVNKIAKIYTREVPEILTADNITVLARANESELVSPNVVFNLTFSICIGIIMSLFIIIIKSLLDNRIRTEKEVETYLGLPVIGSIPKF